MSTVVEDFRKEVRRLIEERIRTIYEVWPTLRPSPDGVQGERSQDDLAVLNQTADMSLAQISHASKELSALNGALKRIDDPNSDWGICRECGDHINPARIRAKLWTRVCITCKEKNDVSQTRVGVPTIARFAPAMSRR